MGTDTSSPYSYSWTGVAAGSYSLTVKAYDNNNAVTTSSAVAITVNTAGNQSPTVSISSPANGASFTAPASITINATAADADGTISKVEFYNGATLLGTDTSSPYSYSWTGVAAGSYSITAKAFDNNNASTTSSAVSVTVNSGTGGYDCSTIETYQTYPKVYNLGDLVKYNGVVYQSQSNALYNVTPGTAEHWWKTMGNCNAGTQALAAPAQDIVTNLYPNPAAGSSVTADVTVVAAEKVTITVTSTQTMQQYFNKTYTASATGTESFTVDISNLPVGTFVLQVTTDHGQSSKTFVRQ
ncbi:Chitodextrinase precursor [compost metagenome]